MKQALGAPEDTGARIVVANAPVSYGAFELTVGIDPDVPAGTDVLDAVAAAGYAGIDLGPVGYLGGTSDLGPRLAARGLGLAGAFVELAFDDAAGLRAGLAQLDAVLDLFDAVRPHVPGPPPRPTLAAVAVAARVELDEASWQRFGQGLDHAVARCRQRGYEPTFHAEVGTAVQSPAEIERVLALSDVGLCLETGHMLLAGADLLEALERWAARINHVHLKDARMDVMRTMIADGAPLSDIWEREAFCALGEGDVDLAAVLQALRATGYEGWLVVEQDVLPRDPNRRARAVRDQKANREYLVANGV